MSPIRMREYGSESCRATVGLSNCIRANDGKMHRIVPAVYRSMLRRWVIVACLAIALAMPGADLLGENHNPDKSPLVALIVANGSTARLSDDRVIANARSLANSLRFTSYCGSSSSRP